MSDTEHAYDHTTVERRWQDRWDDEGVYRTPDDAEDPTYVLGMYPYPSGKLHMGHVRNYTITDAYARFRRMCGDDVLHPMGWDAFGLPAENAAKERDTNPHDWTMDCIDTMREQMRSMGFGYDWEREITTCTPDYYRWNQWLFTRFHEEGLVERRDADVNWCPSCETVLADEQVEGDAELCWRCDTSVEQRELDQWFLAITEYADELLDSIDELEGWPDSVRQMQRNWIGRQEGTRLPFEVQDPDGDDHGTVEAFTTRADTAYGATFFPNGVATDLTATNPVTGEELPVYVADFVLSDVGTGALMGVPGHDERDHEFASALGLDIRPVVAPDEDEIPDVSESAYTDDGVVVNSGDYSGLDSETARERITADTAGAETTTQYRLRDWGISRQRYWGTPIPVVHCDDCGPVTVPDEALPVELPEFINTTGNPLDAAEEWKQTTCPDCGGEAIRETDTMDTFVDSSWYFLRYVSPDLPDAPFDRERSNEWLPVDQYVGGDEHAVMHLLYSRFFTKVLADAEGLAHREPFENLLAQGMVQLDGAKMSKSVGNTVSPQRIVEEYGADTARLFIMEAAQPARDFDWSEQGVRSTRAFLDRLHEQVSALTEGSYDGKRGTTAEYVDSEIDAAVAIAADEYDDLRFNVAVREAQNLSRTLAGYVEYVDAPHAETVERGLNAVVSLLAPVAPHLAEELWTTLGHDEFVAEAAWPAGGDAETATARRDLVKNTREDVRDIVDVAGIEDPERIDVTVTPDWKYEALGIAIESDAPNVISELMSEPSIREQGDAAASYGQTLQENREALTRSLDPETEYETLRRAAWLIEREFDAAVRVQTADAGDAGHAEPGRPAIDITE
ncbi:leucine--tRNA ligase [Halobacteriales archaeon SW_8_65_20]|nr:MAG: leucine--tRNA ligase [Halobacteriales archaeon SW_8_65_20]